MARANDNWERLTEAVLRRNRDWDMCHAHSRTPSISSSAASSSRDHDPLFLDANFESRRYVEDQNLEVPFKTVGIGKTRIMTKRGGEIMMNQRRSYLNSVLMSECDEPHHLSGGGRSQNGKFSYGYASSPGRSPSMEDFYETRIDCVDGEVVALFGVFDGHGGARAAEYVKRNLFINLIKHPRFISDTKSAIVDAHRGTNEELFKDLRVRSMDEGSTACTAILFSDRLLVANVGDSRAVICRGGGKAIAVSEDHKPNRRDELRRIEDAGGFVLWTGGAWKVGGVLQISRAFGNLLLKPYVVADPDIHEEKVDETLEFLVIASHGLWDVFSNEEAVRVIEPIRDPEEAARRLMLKALDRGSVDNITVVVVRFHALSVEIGRQPYVLAN